MKKVTQKGFTLIEMLLVIAVIAVLVSIVVPKVSNATEKSAAAADAANLRSAKAVIAAGMLEGKYTESTAFTAKELDVPSVANYDTKAEFSASISGGSITVAYGEYDIDYLADIADNGARDYSTAGSIDDAPAEYSD